MPSFKIIGLFFLEKKIKILKVFDIYSQGGHHGHVTWIIYTVALPKDAPYEALIGPDVRTLWTMQRRLQRRQTMEHGYTISSPCEPNGSGEPKIAYYLFPMIHQCKDFVN